MLNSRCRYSKINGRTRWTKSLCVCGDKFTVGHAHSCKKGAFVAQRHDVVRDLLTAFINKVCHNVEIEPRLQPLANERPHLRLDIKVGGFWCRGVRAFFVVRVTHVNSKCYQNKTTSELFKEQEDEKKRKYQHRVLEVEMSSFTPMNESMAEWEMSVSVS